MDGVLVDSMPYHYISWYETLRPLGVQASAFDIYEREGEVWHKTLKDLLKRAGIKPNRKLLMETVRKKYKLFRRYFKRHIFKGADEFIFCLKKKGYRLGLVTGTPLPEVKKILPKKMFFAFDAVVTGDIVRKGKPHPEPYMKASAFLGVRPQDCAVIENAQLGIR